jgi:hypothetical protein
LADNPDEGRLCFGLVELVEGGAECGDDALVFGRVLSEDVLEEWANEIQDGRGLSASDQEKYKSKKTLAEKRKERNEPSWRR